MKPQATIKRAYTRRYRDNGQFSAYVEWSDGSRTEGPALKPGEAKGIHMGQLFARALREGAPIEHEDW